jgi:ATP-dependent helicase/nuclease subunit A
VCHAAADPRPWEPAHRSATRRMATWRDSLTTPRELAEETLRTLEARQVAHWIAAPRRQAGLPAG